MEYPICDFFSQDNLQFDAPNKELSKDLDLEINDSDENENTHQVNFENIKTKMTTVYNQYFFQNEEKPKKKIKFLSSKKNLGRKRKNSKEKGKHTKYDGDNIIRKIKSSMIRLLINFINQLILSLYGGKIGYGPQQKTIFTIKPKQIINSKNDKEFINRSLKEILSEQITERISNFQPDHNKNIIELLLNEEDDLKREKFENFFNLKFIDCVMHYCGKNEQKILLGLETLQNTCNIMKTNKVDEDYIKLYTHYVFNFEDTINRKKNRNKKGDDTTKKEAFEGTK